MAEKEEKFIVIKIKDLKEYQFELDNYGLIPHEGRGDAYWSKEGREGAKKNLEGFFAILKELDNGNKYVVFDQNEPYAKGMWDIIIAFEDSKELLANAVLGKKSPGNMHRGD